MCIYFKKLTKLRKDINILLSKRKKKPNKEQKIMIDFINGQTKYALFEINSKKIYLYRGDEKKGFEHILLRHYDCNGCNGELTASDIINLIVTYKKGIKLNKEGVSNSNLTVYQSIKGMSRHKLVLKEKEKDSFVITYYSIGGWK